MLASSAADQSGFAGTSVRLGSLCLSVPAPAHDFVTNEVWDGVGGGTYWTEAGEAYGEPQGARPYFFWAETRPHRGYYEHDAATGPSMGVQYHDRIRYLGGATWTVDVAGFRGIARDAAGPADLLEVGTETTSNATTVAGSASGLSYYAWGGAMRPSWSAGILASFPSAWGYERWTRTNRAVQDGHSGRWGCWAGAASARSVRRGARRRAHMRARSAGASGSGGLTPAQLRATATELAAANGDPFPTQLRVFGTTRALALAAADPGSLIQRAPGELPAAVEPAYLVVAEGSFTGLAAKVLPGAASPAGSVLTAVIDARSGRITDWGISSVAPDLTPFGVVRSLLPLL